MGGVAGQSICQDCVTKLLEGKTPEELLALAKVGIDAVIDEATGYQDIRPKGNLKELHKKYSK
jgi:predicted RNase H-like HicB family nuclease